MKTYSLSLFLVFLSAVSLFAQNLLAQPGAYYVSLEGNDSLSGTSPEKAWESIEKVNSISFLPGDVVHFKGGQRFSGSLVLNEEDGGEEGNRVELTSYGEGRAIIDAGEGSAFRVSGSSHLLIHHLSLRGSGRKEGNRENGMHFTSCSHISVDSLDVSGFQHSGIIFTAYGTGNRITHVDASENGFAGIFIYGVYMDKESQSDLYIAHCRAFNNPGDPTVTDNHSGNGILVVNASDLTIEYCEADNNGWDLPWTGNGPGGIWVAEVDRATIQHCISHDNKTSSGQDGIGFDLDGGTTNSVIQYCLSYNNMGSGFGVFQYSSASEWSNNTIRYCISENDGNESAEGSLGIWNGAKDKARFHDLHFYNNVIYNENGRAIFFIDHYNENFFFRNNVFVSSDDSIYGGTGSEVFQTNYWHSLSEDGHDPEFLSPGNSSLTDPEDMAGSEDYMTAPSSPLINAGLDLQSLFGIDPGLQDFAGNSIPRGSQFDIGACENDFAETIRFQGMDQAFAVFPNPSSDGNIQIRFACPAMAGDFHLSLVDVCGRVVRDMELHVGGQQEISFDLGPDIVPDYYLLHLRSSAFGAFVRPLVIR